VSDFIGYFLFVKNRISMGTMGSNGNLMMGQIIALNGDVMGAQWW
jgi:hypothetical protein